jgi:hypothetical protein
MPLRRTIENVHDVEVPAGGCSSFKVQTPESQIRIEIGSVPVDRLRLELESEKPAGEG